MKKRYKNLTAFLMALIVALASLPLQALAYDVSDNVIEWDEIEEIVTRRNPTYTLIMDSALDSIDLIIEGVSDDILSLKESISVSSGPVRDILKDSLSQMGSTLRTLRYSEKRLSGSLSLVRIGLEQALRTLIISKKMLEVNASMLDKQISLYEELLLEARRMEGEGLLSASELSGYERNLSEARRSLSELESASAKLMGNILLLSGYEQGEDVELGDLPSPDKDFLLTRDISSDRERYIASSSEVISAQDVDAYTGDVFKYRDLELSLATADAASQFNTLYTALETAAAELEAKEISLSMARIQSDAASRELSLGLISRGEYEALCLQSIAESAAYELAALSLHQAITDYTAACP